MATDTDLIIVGAGAAGLFAGIWAARTNPRQHITLLDGARKLGAKILVAGGGRCNVTHDVVDEHAYAGASRNAIRKVLRRFDAAATVAFFREQGVALKREPTGKLFPTTDSAHTVLDALLSALDLPNVTLAHPRRVDAVEQLGAGFQVSGTWGSLTGTRLILATGGRSLPKSGSDGGGYALAQTLGHTLTPRIFPALVPLTLPRDHFVTTLTGLAVEAALSVRAADGRTLAAYTGSTLCTHFGLSGPAVLDISRYYTAAHLDDPGVFLVINWLPHMDETAFEAHLLDAGKQSSGRVLGAWLPERLARALCLAAGVDPATRTDQMTRLQRRALVAQVSACPLPVTGDRGFTYAEVTAGGVPLSELRLETLESRLCPGLHLCGELCDVDGRIGGYNFQWAWASGYVAGVSAASL